MSQEKNKNFLEFKPHIKTQQEWYLNAKGHIEVCMPHEGFFAGIAQTIFHRPRCTYVELEEMGSFIWRQMDGERNVYDIGQLVHERFKIEAEPLYERLCPFIKQLEVLNLIEISK